MTTGARPEERRDTLSFAYLVARAFQAESGVDVDGGRDYRGVHAVGAWKWLPQYDFGVITKVDRAEAYRIAHHSEIPLSGACSRCWPPPQSLLFVFYRHRGATAKARTSGRPSRQAARAIHARCQDRRGGDGCGLPG